METKKTTIMKTWIVITLLAFASTGLKSQTLNEYLEVAAENNPGLKAKYAEFEASMQRSAQVAQMPNPTLSFGYFIQPIETRVGPQRAKIGLSQMFPWFGTLKSRSDAAAFIAEAKYFAFIDAREQLFESVRVAYYRLYENEKLEALEKENLSILETLRDLSQNKYENAEGSLADVYRTEVIMDESRTRIDLLKAQRTTLSIQFNNLLNRDNATSIHIEDSLPTSLDSIALVSESFENHPKMRSIHEMQASAYATEHAAQRAGYPGIGLGVDYVFVGERTDVSIPGSGKNALMPMVSLSLPIYRKGYAAARTEAQKQQDSYAFLMQETDNMLESELEKANYNRLEAQSNYDLLSRQIAKTETIIKLLLSQYSNDALDFEVLLREQQKLLNYRKNQLRELVKEHVSLAHIAYLKTESNESK
ncbi:MAG: TolC family protein [Flavobacteriales bacterium]